MDALFDLGLETTRWLQTTYPQLAGFFRLLTAFGDLEFYLVVLPLVYWCVDKQFGKHATYLLAFTYVINSTLKHFLESPRPFWLDESVGLSDAAGYGVPSGHTQSAATLYLLLAGWYRRRWLWGVALVLVVLMGLSRIYLGVHFLQDVALGLLLGVTIVSSYGVWRRYHFEKFRNRILGQRLLPAVLVPVGLALISGVLWFLRGAPDESVAWAARLPMAELQALEELTASLALLLGGGIGFVLEPSRIGFLVTGPWWKRALRYLLGLSVTLAIWAGLRAVFPTEPDWLGLILRFVRYALLSLWVSYYAPLVFVRLKLADVSTQPEGSISVSPNGILKG